MAPVVGIQKLPAYLLQSLHHTGSQPREEIPPGSRTRASRVAAVPSHRVKAAAAHSDPLAGLSEASGGVWSTEVSQGPHPHLSGAAHSVCAGAQQASCLSIFRARTDDGGGLESLMMVTFLFTDMAGSTPYLIPKLSFPRAHVVSCVDTDIDIPSVER